MEQSLLVGILLTLVGIVGTTVHLTAVSRLHTKMVGNVDTVIQQLDSDVLI